ncbi:MAG: 50S ribosomal protein L11 methyltransferase, partial [Acidobacteriota bacterium]|nr:50S ribosomal protein L11 methyltransferase [Acidobacteriota bacterium]
LGGCELVAAGQLDEGDWLAPYRERAMPRPVGRLLIVDPREPHTQAGRGAARDPVSGRTLLRLPARTAFGTGSHESTRLAIELLERQDVEGLRVLDVGSGTGILAFVSLVLGARSVVGVEIDAAAALTASENQRLNEMFFGLVVGAPGCLRAGSQFDLGLVNVVPDAIRSELPMIAGLLRKGGRAVFSGFLVDQAGEVLPRLRRHGFEPLDDLRESEWMAVLVERGGAR